jgi:hypothetical protein
MPQMGVAIESKMALADGAATMGGQIRDARH